MRLDISPEVLNHFNGNIPDVCIKLTQLMFVKLTKGLFSTVYGPVQNYKNCGERLLRHSQIPPK